MDKSAALDDFTPAGALSAEGAEIARTRLPGWLSEFVLTHGTGTFMGGYLKVIDPAAWAPALAGCYVNAGDSVAVMATGLADLIVWDEAGGVGGLLLLELRRQDLGSLYDELFFRLLDDPGFRDEELDMGAWAPASRAWACPPSMSAWATSRCSRSAAPSPPTTSYAWACASTWPLSRPSPAA